jgi:hypothetical protein
MPPVSGIIDFTGGLIYGLTGDNHLDELQNCMNVSEPMLEDFENLITDISAFHVGSAIADLGDIIWQLPVAFAGCNDMSDDIQAIEDWAQIFKQPVSLAEEVAKNWIFHGVAIEANIDKTKADWTAGSYESSGEDAAAVLVGLLGPINPAYGTLDAHLIPDMVAGFVYGENHQSPAPFASSNEMKTYFETCYVANPTLDAAVDSAMTAIAACGDDTDCISAQVQTIMAQVPLAFQCFSGCSKVSSDIAHLQSYFGYINGLSMDQKYALIMAAMRSHFKDIKTDAAALAKAYDETPRDYFMTGYYFDLIAEIALPPKATLSTAMAPNLIPDMVAGFVYGENHGSPAPFASTDEMKSYMETCYVANPTLDAAVDAAITAIAGCGDDTDCISAQVQTLMAQIPLAFQCFSGCS